MSRERLTVLHVITRSDWGGAGHTVKYLASSSSVRATVACGPGGRLIEELQSDDVPVDVINSLQSPPNPIRDTIALVRLIKVISDRNPDLVHCHSTKAGFLGRVAAKTVGVPCVFTVQGWGYYNTEYKFLHAPMKFGERITSRITDGYALVSMNDLERGEAHDITSGTYSKVIRNGVPKESAGNKRAIYEEFGIDSSKLVLGSACRLSHQKAPRAMLEAARALRNQSHEFELVLIGDGPLMDDCRRFVDDNGLENVHLPGFRSDVRRLLPGMDVYLMTSRFEGFPLSIVEAMHAGVPVVSFDVGGVREAVDEGKTGHVVEQNDLREFVAKVSDLIGDDEKRERFGDAAREKAASEFTVDNMVSEYMEFYKSVLGDNRSEHVDAETPSLR